MTASLLDTDGQSTEDKIEIAKSELQEKEKKLAAAKGELKAAEAAVSQAKDDDEMKSAQESKEAAESRVAEAQQEVEEESQGVLNGLLNAFKSVANWVASFFRGSTEKEGETAQDDDSVV